MYLKTTLTIIHENLNGGHRSTRDRLVPSCVFIDPELARVGLNESQAREKGIAYRVASVPVDFRLAALDHFGETRIHEDAHRHETVTAFSDSRPLDQRPANSWARFNSRCWQALPTRFCETPCLRTRP